MKVRITHSVDLDGVPSQVGGLLEATLDEMCEVAETMRATTCMIKKNLAVKECVKILDECRQQLAAVDASFAESSSLLEGYVQAIEPPEPAPEPAPEKVTRLKDVPRGKTAVRYEGNIDEALEQLDEVLSSVAEETEEDV